MKLINIIIVLLLLASCTTQRKAYSWLDKHPIKAAEYSVSRFPVKSDSILLPGKITTLSDTLYLPGDTIPCPPANDTPAYVVCPPSKVIRDSIFIRDTLRIVKENPAKEVIIRDQENTIAIQKNSIDNYKNKLRKRTGTLVILFILVGGFLAFKILRWPTSK